MSISLTTRFFSLILVFFVGGVGCAQTQPLRRTQAEYHDEYDGSYYRRNTPERSVESVEYLIQPKQRVMVLDFWNNTPIQDEELGRVAADELRRALFMSQRVVLPPQVQGHKRTEEFLAGDRVRVAQLVREGKQSGVAVGVLGRIARIAFRQTGDDVGLLRQKQSLAIVEVELKAFDLRSGREMISAGRTAQATANVILAMEDESLEGKRFRSELTQRALRNAADVLVLDVLQALDKMAWEGRIAKKIGHKYYTNAGRKSGLLIGDILKVMTPGDDVYDPMTGAFLGRTEGQLKGTLEVVDFVGDDAAVTHLHSGGNLQEGDIVRLY
jgi:hypothetical protein